MDSGGYLTSLQHNIRARPIPWEGAVRAGTISEHDLKTIKQVDKVRSEQRRETIERDPALYAALVLGGGAGRSVFDSAAKRADVIQYMLVLINDLLNDCSRLSDELLQHDDPYRPILPYLTHSSEAQDAVPLLAANLLTTLCANAQSRTSKLSGATSDALKRLFTFLSRLVRHQDHGLKDIAVFQYSSLVKSHRARELYWDQRLETLSPIVEILDEAAGSVKDSDSAQRGNTVTSIRSINESLAGGVSLQLLYHVLLVIWQLSFEAALIGESLQRNHDIITLYAQLVRVSPKEKTTRLLLATLRNLLTSPDCGVSLLSTATTVRLPVILQNLKARHLTDPDLLDDLNVLVDVLNEYTSSQTTLDEYAAEVHSGRLRWSPPHRDANFWTTNARKIISNDDGALLKELVKIMSKEWSNDKTTPAVACNDVGCLVREVPEQRGKLEKMGLKARVMALMQDRDEGVRWESLRAVGEWLRYSFDG